MIHYSSCDWLILHITWTSHDLPSNIVIILGEVPVPDLNMKSIADFVVVYAKVKLLPPLRVEGLGYNLALVLLTPQFELTVRVT